MSKIFSVLPHLMVNYSYKFYAFTNKDDSFNMKWNVSKHENILFKNELIRCKKVEKRDKLFVPVT